ncbi:MAG: hypothetical protein JKY40_08250, partial [Gammaproteobacteria bacterium]|nr:hypothetical protein [Gammaproteobacteria bacterium]
LIMGPQEMRLMGLQVDLIMGLGVVRLTELLVQLTVLGVVVIPISSKGG